MYRHTVWYTESSAILINSNMDREPRELKPGLMFPQMFSKWSSWEKYMKLSTIPITSKAQSPWNKHDFGSSALTRKLNLVRSWCQMASTFHRRTRLNHRGAHPFLPSTTSLCLCLLLSYTMSFIHTRRYKYPIMENRWTKDDQRTQGKLTPKPQTSMISSLLHGLILSYSCLIHNKVIQKTLSCSKGVTSGFAVGQT